MSGFIRLSRQKCALPARPSRQTTQPAGIDQIAVVFDVNTRRRGSDAAAARSVPGPAILPRKADREIPHRNAAVFSRQEFYPIPRAARRPLFGCKWLRWLAAHPVPCRLCSTITTWRAPRDAASKPSAPLPANRSRQYQPVKFLTQPVEQLFAHRIRGWPQPGSLGEIEQASPPVARR